MSEYYSIRIILVGGSVRCQDSLISRRSKDGRVHLESLAATLGEVFLAAKVLGSHLLPEIHAAAPRSGPGR